MDLTPYIQNDNVTVTVTYIGVPGSFIKGRLIEHTENGVVLLAGGDLNFIPWSAIAALSVSEKDASIPAPRSR